MAMYYYARRLQKSSKKNRTIQRDPIALNSNGVLPSTSLGICTPVKVSNLNKVCQVVGSVSGPGSGMPSTSSSGQQYSQPQPGLANLRGSGVGESVGVTVTKNGSSANSKCTNSPNGGQVGANCESSNNLRYEIGPAGGLLSQKTSSHLGKAVNHHVISGNLLFDFEDGHLISGTLDGLVDYLVPAADHFPEKSFIFAFILSSRIYIRPHQLLATVLHRAFLNRNEEDSAVSNLVRLLGEWTQIFPYDFRDDAGLMMANVRAITHKCVNIMPSMKKEVSILLTSLLDRLQVLEKFESNLAKINAEQIASNHGTMEEGSKLQQLCPDPRLIAEQLALVEVERFGFIGIQEFIQAFIKEPYSPPCNSTTNSNTGDSPSPVISSNGGGGGPGSGKSKKSRLESYVEWFHRLSLCVATDICKCGRKKDRVRILEFWTEIGSSSVTFGNFNSAIAIFTAINSNPVRRLTKTWSKFTGQEHLATLESCFDPTNNFASYRSRLKGGGGGSPELKSSDSPGMVVPFFSLLIKDLFFLKEAVTGARLPNGHLPFSNFLQLGSCLSQVWKWQQQPVQLNKVPELGHVIQTLPALSESALLLASFECEGPSSPEEKTMLESLLAAPQPEDDELTDSFQSLPLPSTSSGSTSGVHEDDSVGISPTEIHKFLQFKFAQNQGSSYVDGGVISSIFSGTMSSARGGSDLVSEVQVHLPPQGQQPVGSGDNGTGTIKLKQKPPVPL